MAGNLASHVIGYTGKITEESYNEQKDIYDMDDIVGKTGIEYLFEEPLRGKDGEKQVSVFMEEYVTK